MAAGAEPISNRNNGFGRDEIARGFRCRFARNDRAGDENNRSAEQRFHERPFWDTLADNRFVFRLLPNLNLSLYPESQSHLPAVRLPSASGG